MGPRSLSPGTWRVKSGLGPWWHSSRPPSSSSPPGFLPSFGRERKSGLLANRTGQSLARFGESIAVSLMPGGAVVLKLARRRTVVTCYPFLQFLSVIVTPSAYWIAYVELGVFNQWDIDYSLTFGQVSPVRISPWCDANARVRLGARYIRDCASNDRNSPFNSCIVALVHQPALGPVHHWTSSPQSSQSRRTGVSCHRIH